MVINVLMACTVAQHCAAQPAALYIKPYLGVQQPFSKKIFTQVTTADVSNNRRWFILTYGLRIEADKPRHRFVLEVQNGQAGYYTGFEHGGFCSNQNIGFTNNYDGGSANNNRFFLAYSKLVNRHFNNTKKIYGKCFIGTGLTVDIRASEDLNAGKFYSGGTSRCGVQYVIVDTAYNIRNFNVGIPVLIDYSFYRRNKQVLSLHLFANFGLRRLYTQDVIYKTAAADFITRLTCRGTAVGLAVSVPVKLLTLDQ